MDKNPNSRNIPDVIINAYSLLLQHRIVKITEPIHENLGKGAMGWVFECVSKVPYPNREGIPCKVPLKFLISEKFLTQPVQVFSLCEKVSGFPHQDAESKKLCLPEAHRAPRDASRLTCYVKWAIEWLEDAATGKLLQDGDPYELPDFSRKLLKLPLPTQYPLIFNESSITYDSWKPHIGEFGHVECNFGVGIQAIFANRFTDKNGSLIRESEFARELLQANNMIHGKWIILPDIRFERHRPPQTYKEINELCTNNGLNFYTILKKAWNPVNQGHFGILLIGFPIPKIVGQSLNEIHWQPLLFQNYRGYKTKNRRKLKGQFRKPKIIWQRLIKHYCFSPSQQLPWGKVENITNERLYARGAYSSEVQATPIAFFGCGALGSSVAEFLARGGVKQINLFDPDSIKFGNLCRHTLDGSSVSINKAKALAERLSLANPLSTIKGHPLKIPLDSCSDEVINRALKNAHIFIDCTTSETAFEWLDQYAVENNKRLISLFFNFHAELLTICVSGDSMSCGSIFADLNFSIQQNQTPLDPKIYFFQPSKEEQIIEGAGCWHPSFPALGSHVQILAAHAVDILSHYISLEERIGVAAIVKRQTVTQSGVQTGPLVEVLWKKEY